MKKLTISFKIKGNIKDAEKWPQQGEDYGYVVYHYSENSYSDSGGYLMSYMWAMLENLLYVFPKKEEYRITSLDGDFGLDVIPGDKVKLRIYSGTKTIYLIEMTVGEFYEFCLESFESYLQKIYEQNPKLEDNENVKRLAGFKEKIENQYRQQFSKI